jgi:hypothetical protein
MAHSLVARALGEDFAKLHPEVARRHHFASEDGLYSIGVGTMDRIWTGSRLYAPFLRLGARRNIMFPETGENVPFRIECWAYADSHGRETLSLSRSFGVASPRRFDEYVVSVPAAPTLIIYVGTHQHLAVHLDVAVSARGGLEFRTGSQRLISRVGSFRFPLSLSAEAVIHEWYDDSAGHFRIDGRVRNRFLGDVFCCVGSFQSTLEPLPESGVPQSIRPVDEEERW